MSVLKSYIRNFLNERVSAEMSASLKRVSSLSAYFDVVPRLSELDKNSVYGELKDKGMVKGFWDNGPSSSNWLVFEKTKDNLEYFIEVIEKKSSKVELSLDREFILSTLKDDLPLILGQAGGDYGEWLSGKKTIVRRTDINDIAWAIHDMYHPNESNLPELFPSPRSSLDTFEWKLGDNRDVVLKNIMNFFNKEGFTLGVGADDAYASIWAYVVMNIDSEEQIEKLDIIDDSKKYFKDMLKLVRFFEEWLNENKGKVFVNYSV